MLGPATTRLRKNDVIRERPAWALWYLWAAIRWTTVNEELELTESLAAELTRSLVRREHSMHGCTALFTRLQRPPLRCIVVAACGL